MNFDKNQSKNTKLDELRTKKKQRGTFKIVNFQLELLQSQSDLLKGMTFLKDLFNIRYELKIESGTEVLYVDLSTNEVSCIFKVFQSDEEEDYYDYVPIDLMGLDMTGEYSGFAEEILIYKEHMSKLFKILYNRIHDRSENDY